MAMNIGKDVKLAAQNLRKGELVGIPTETVYGLAGNALSEDAVLKIYAAKNRPQFNPLILHIAHIDQLNKLGLSLPFKAMELAARFSPGPITFLVPKSEKIPDIVTAGTPAVAIRIPDHPLTLELLREIDFPLAAPSANPSGYVSPTTALHVFEQLGDMVSYILDGGECRVGLESTIISFLGEEPELLRYGGAPLEAIEAVIGPVKLPEKGYSDNPVAPGMLARHYATAHPLLLGNMNSLLEQHQGKRLATISFREEAKGIPATHQFILSPSGSLEEAAKRLFAAMRMADSMDIDLIIAERFPEQGLGKAINDRLNRASTPA
ncbi:threonylcarbamoyl-AMP synthase [Flavihumibacter rivuli]|uniref:L-threonylcarbamoyladenylate synthase n=1 Tax=Flavihumibacter rivuli TaxID=2838156 RepID=UPI001BDE8A5E|nr:L-threonylcarbamoyladenylate synthase [Flavihumibacter rivuli]ULQ57212.1 threonylcarbamoyl-AMP synthase [Flavihumibacter rivuli]